jgi:hypothetical protein
LWDDDKKAKSFPLAPIAVEILFIFPLKIKRLQRIAGRFLQKKTALSAPKYKSNSG